ncbi:hypothetical protein XA68_12967 [Ophiocordyceps unilateralis]|uniref:Uncharacterized protein n=1 Tax=Ophiocordyceps unilateralis TaxID=268505 RepID=A0A2A9PDL4_OPHUN|nr:hypothetical protein XA68_12967 [Ophiocordyceps unilateralis]
MNMKTSLYNVIGLPMLDLHVHLVRIGSSRPLLLLLLLLPLPLLPGFPYPLPCLLRAWLIAASKACDLLPNLPARNIVYLRDQYEILCEIGEPKILSHLFLFFD